MKRNNLIFLLALQLCLANGCVTMSTYDSVQRTPTKEIEIFRKGSTPSRPYKEIGTIEQKGDPGQQAAIERRFVAKAKAIGGNGLILRQSQTLGASSEFRAAIIIYE